MTQKFIKKIKIFNFPLFYNTDGNPQAYKLNIRHLSAVSSSSMAQLINGYIHPKETLYIVNLEKEIIESVSTKIKLINLQILN